MEEAADEMKKYLSEADSLQNLLEKVEDIIAIKKIDKDTATSQLEKRIDELESAYGKASRKATYYQKKADMYIEQSKVPCKKGCKNVYKAVPVGEPLTLELSGINPYKYDVAIKGEPVSTSNLQSFELLMQAIQRAFGGQYPVLGEVNRDFTSQDSTSNKFLPDICDPCTSRLNDIAGWFREEALFDANSEDLKNVRKELQKSIETCAPECESDIKALKALEKLTVRLIEIADSLERYDYLVNDIESRRDQFVCLYKSLLNDNNSNCFHEIIIDLRGARSAIKSDIILMRAIQKVVGEKYKITAIEFKNYEKPLDARASELKTDLMRMMWSLIPYLSD
ncbi:MAG: hypothetical protein IPN22_07450 [Bacteroidetes bacterium]|nr:hypothetical protein [Bacteroidota bacterium]